MKIQRALLITKRCYSTPIFNNFKQEILKNENNVKQKYKREQKHKSYQSYKNMYSCLPIYKKDNK